MTLRYYVTVLPACLALIFLIAGFQYGAIPGYFLAMINLAGFITAGYWLGLRDR